MNYYEYLVSLQKKYGTTNSELLEELAACGIRITKSNLSHKLSGDRRITEDELDVMLQTICPSNAEERMLRSLFRIDRFGEEKYRDAQLIRQSIEMLSDETVSAIPASGDVLRTGSIQGEMQMREVIRAALRNVWGKAPVRALCQPQDQKLTDALAALSVENPAPVKQLFCLDNDAGCADRNYNIQALFAADRLALLNSRYEIKYFYDKMDARANAFTPFPFFLICGGILILFAHDCKSGYLMRDDAFIARLTEEFDRMFESAQTLTERIESTEQVLQKITSLESESNGSFFRLQRSFSFLNGLDAKALHACTPRDDPTAQKLASMQLKRMQENEKAKRIGTVLHTDNNVSDFMETGRFYDLPDGFLMNAGIELRESIVKRAKAEHHPQRLIRKGCMELGSGLAITCYDSGTVLISRMQADQCLCLLTGERRFFRSVMSFFDYLIQFESGPD